MSDEVWRPVIGWPGYEVSDQGRVRSVDRVVIRSDGISGHWKGCVLRPTPTSDGYLRVGLRRDGTEHKKGVHVLVATAFHGPCPYGLQCRHVNGDPADNRPDNLKWGTPSENTHDKVRHKTHSQARKTRCPQNHPYDEANTYHYQGERGCRTCRAEAHRRYLAKKVSA